jgi:4a-hydroxytetrahydrobiopterin dehydratase
MILESQHIQEVLQGTGWIQKGKSLVKTFKFDSYMKAISFVNTVASLAEDMHHHPEITIHYDRVRLQLSTHEEGGVTDKDVSFAHEVEEI